MELKIDQSTIESAIQEHLNEVVKRGVDYKVKDAINQAIADAITPEVVSGYAEAAVRALTDPTVSQRIVSEMHAAIAEAVRLTMQEAVVAVAARLRGYSPSRSGDDQARLDALRERLFPK
jgi:methyl coenzyme M reductase alpha subunit